jgi:hypothetical protein
MRNVIEVLVSPRRLLVLDQAVQVKVLDDCGGLPYKGYALP